MQRLSQIIQIQNSNDKMFDLQEVSVR